MNYQGGQPYESGHPIDGVGCSVKTCVHHHSGNTCTASHIDVSNENSNSAVDTFCRTFEKK